MPLRAVLCAGLLAFAGAASAALPVSEEDYGEGWPLRIERGEVDCEMGMAYVFRAGRRTYALNPFARSHGYAALEPIWQDDPGRPGRKRSIARLLTLAQAQCARGRDPAR